MLGALVLVAAGRWQPSREGPSPNPWVLGGSGLIVATWVARLARLSWLGPQGALGP